MPMAASTENSLSSRQIASWLRKYRDWKAEVSEPGAAPSMTDFRQVPGGGDGTPGGPTAREAERLVLLRERVATVEQWLGALTPGERVAAGYWLADEEGTFGAVAEALGIDVRRAKALVLSIPLIIWLRFYAQALDDNACQA